MPIYEYRCSECGFQDEFLQKHTEPPMTLCPSCGKEGLRKLLSAAGFQLKGSGWYATDFKGSGSKPAGKPAASAQGGTDGEGAATGDKASGGKAANDTPAGDGGAAKTAKAPPASASN